MKQQLKKNFKYAIFDLDGTLLNKEKDITPLNLKALELLRENGIKIGIATGRPQMMIRSVINKVNPELPIISVNGGLILKGKKVINDKSFNNIDTTNIYKWLIKENIDFLAYTKDKMYFNDVANTNWIIQIKEKLKTIPEDERWEFTSNELPSNTRVSKFLILTEKLNEDVKLKIEVFFSKISNVYLVESLPIVLDVMPKGIDKGSALVALENTGHINIEETMVFGDALNDLPMFDVAKLSISVPNSHETVKSVANINLEDETDDYIYNFVKTFIEK